MKKALSAIAFLILCRVAVYAVSVSPSHQLFADSVITGKNFPFLALIEHDTDLRNIVQADGVFKAHALAQKKRVSNALLRCQDVSCYAESLQWSPSEIGAIGSELISLYTHNKTFRKLIPVLKKNGSYHLYDSEADTAFLRSVWNNVAKGMNHVMDTYIKGQKPQYPKIDSIDFRPGDAAFKKKVNEALTRLLAGKSNSLFFELPLDASLFALNVNGRDEAARYEPLKDDMNRLPFSGIKNVKWDSYQYSMILVPGLGPETPGLNLDPGGASRCEEAVKRFRKGLAPFIVVSGGHVHPNKTPYCEAVEMKRYLTTQLGIPDSVVFIEPHARHTTTNIRNANRMIYRFAIPAEKPVLIVTDDNQSSYIVERMAKVAMRDLGYLPYRDMKKLGPEDTEYYPVLNSLEADPIDPLDP